MKNSNYKNKPSIKTPSDSSGVFGLLGLRHVNKLWKITIIIFALIMLLIYSEHIMAFGKKVAFKQRGYVICKDIKCMNENLQICNKAYWNDFTGSSWAESFVEGHDNDDCIFITKRSNKVKTTCSFGKDIFSKELVDEVFGVHKGLEKVVAENCKQTLTK